jgi:type II secretory pathway component GspD/PulD (secretin)
MMRQTSSRPVPTALMAAILVYWSVGAHAQSRGHIKIVLQTKQTGTSNQETVQGSGSIIIRRGGAQPSGRLTAGEKQTTVQSSTGIFTLVQDGGESILSVATRVPQNQVRYYREYASGIGYIDRQILFTEVGTSLRVSASALAEGQIRVKLTPRISYFSAERSGAIDLTEATTELIVPHGQPVSLGGSTTRIHEVTRQILGYSDRTSSSETDLVITATLP